MEVYQLVDYVYAAVGLAGIISIPFAFIQMGEWYTKRCEEVERELEEEYRKQYGI